MADVNNNAVKIRTTAMTRKELTQRDHCFQLESKHVQASLQIWEQFHPGCNIMQQVHEELPREHKPPAAAVVVMNNVMQPQKLESLKD